jgi:hypothetical protein
MRTIIHPRAINAHGAAFTASLEKDGDVTPRKPERLSLQRIPRRVTGLTALALVVAVSALVGCEAPKSAQETQAKPAEPVIPEDVQAGAQALLGSEVTVLLFGDLAKNGKEEFLAANVVPKTPKNTIPGTVVTRAVIAEKEGDKWIELFRCDEHLQNQKGFLGLTPLEPVTGWRVQYEQDSEKGLALYLTPVKGLEDRHVLPIGVRWNPAAKRYQSLDRSYEHFLREAPSLSNSRSRLR